MHLFDARYEQRDDQESGNLMKIRQGITAQENTLEISLEELAQNKKNKGITSMTAGELLERLNNEEKLASLSEKEKREEISAAKTEMQQAHFVFPRVLRLRADRRAAGDHGASERDFRGLSAQPCAWR